MSHVGPRLTLRKAMLIVALSAVVFAAINTARGAREGIRQAECSDHLKQIGLGLHNFHSAMDSLPAGTVQGTNLPPEKRFGWMFVVLAYLEQSQLSYEYERLMPWDSPVNLAFYVSGVDDDGKPFRQPVGEVACFQCPFNQSKTKPGQVGDGHFVGIAGVGLDAPSLPQGHPRAGVFGYDRATKFSDITDGLNQTMVVVETCQNNGPFTAGGLISLRGLDPAKPPYIGGKKGQFGGTHPGGANVLFADGSVRFIRDTIAPKTFEALSTISGGEPAPIWP